ncbi:MAG TPA: aldehyde dehydrogenase family protein [Steroidobacteraceae bacterium]|jgi:acyl-CoA reductase-like NAD-dependent aldehyde dehydrogenase|nr:aldehyde dehydrogenase family protein [Steroidobacteraceae bacterium]
MDQKITNPATLVPLGAVADSSADDIERALTAAAGAAPAWREVPAAERAALLRNIAARIGAAARELAGLSSRESGQPLCESLDAVRAAVASFELYAARAGQNAGDGDGDGDGNGDDRGGAGAGTVAVVAPFNLALPVMAAGAARALAAGRCVVCKPPIPNPLASLELFKTFEALPAGAAGIVTGGAQVARALIAHPQIDAAMFTGSAAEGRELEDVAGGKVLDLETATGGVHIVCGSADLDLAVPAIAWNRLMNGGQGWASGHLYVERSVVAELVDRMHQCIGFLDVDDPAKPSTDLGPLISADAARRIEDQVGRTLRDGAKLILGGRRFRPSGLPGHFFQPTILSDVRPGSLPLREEIAGPVITVTPVADLATALGLWAESARSGLRSAGASIYTGDAEAAARDLQAVAGGLFRINDPTVGTLGPFSGIPHRAIRLALGAARTVERSDRQIEISPAIERKAWWFPYVDRRA